MKRKFGVELGGAKNELGVPGGEAAVIKLEVGGK